jgi:soluble lytic murein transglycosylase-like protein
VVQWVQFTAYDHGVAGVVYFDFDTVPVSPMIKPATGRVDHASSRLRSTSALLVDAMIHVESRGDPLAVGAAGERGLMQIMPTTWEETTRRMYRKPVPFGEAFNPDVNRDVGTRYLRDIQGWLSYYSEQWDSDLRSLILASYNAGFTSVAERGFDVNHMPRRVREYVARCSALHDDYMQTVADPKVLALVE